MTDVTNSASQDHAELPAGDEQLLRELAERPPGGRAEADLFVPRISSTTLTSRIALRAGYRGSQESVSACQKWP